MSKVYTCFVITPFGVEHSDQKYLAALHAHVNKIYSIFFEPAKKECAKAGFEVNFEDGRPLRQGKKGIWNKIREAIDDADVIITVLATNIKPNTFIELGLAYGTWREPILLLSDKMEKPSDINNLEHIDYSLQSLTETVAGKAAARVVVHELTQRIIGAIKNDRCPRPEYLDKTTAAARGTLNVYNRFLRAITEKEWSDTLTSAQKEIVIAAPKCARIMEQGFEIYDEKEDTYIDTDLKLLLFKRASAGVKVTVLMNHQDNFSLGHMKRRSGSKSLEDMQNDIRQAFKEWSTIRANYLSLVRKSQIQDSDRHESHGVDLSDDGFRVIQIHERYLPYRVTLTERRALVTLRFFTEKYNSGLLIDAPNPNEESDEWERSFYTQIKEELNFLIKENEDRSNDEFYREYPALRRM